MDNNKPKAEKSVHAGHRSRVREKLMTNTSFESLADNELLEFILFHAIPRGDTNPLAHKIIEKMGSFNNVLEASPYELMQIEGIGETTALLIASYLAVAKRYMIKTLEPKPVFDNMKDLKKYFQALCMGNKYECAYALFLDKSKRLIRSEKVSEGGIDATGFYPEKIVEKAILYKAYFVILGHNHTSGNTLPSEADVMCAEKLAAGLANVNKHLIDSLIVDHMSAFSMAENGIIADNRVINPYEKPTKYRIEE